MVSMRDLGGGGQLLLNMQCVLGQPVAVVEWGGVVAASGTRGRRSRAVAVVERGGQVAASATPCFSHFFSLYFSFALMCRFLCMCSCVPDMYPNMSQDVSLLYVPSTFFSIVYKFH